LNHLIFLSENDWKAFLFGLLGVLLLYYSMRKESWQNPLFIIFFYFHLYRKVNEEEKLAFANATLDYCLRYIGQCKVKKPIIVFRNEKHPTALAIYDYESTRIVLFSPSHRTCKQIVDSVIHEYCHYLIIDKSNIAEYHRTQKQFKEPSINGPHEYLSNELAKKYYKDAFAFSLHKLGYCSLTRQF